MEKRDDIDLSKAKLKPGINNIYEINARCRESGGAGDFAPQYILPPEIRAKNDIKKVAMRVGVVLMIFCLVQIAVSSFYAAVCGFSGNGIPATGSVEYQIYYAIAYVTMFMLPTVIGIILPSGAKFRIFPESRPSETGADADDEARRKFDCRLRRYYEMKESRARDYICLAVFTLATSYSGLFIANYIESFINGFGIATDLSLFETSFENTAARLINAGVVCIVAPICEELLFRGVILQNLRRFGDAFAIACSAVLFGLMHGNIYQIPHAIIGGLIFGYIAVKRNSIVSSMILHFASNFAVTLADALLTGKTAEQNPAAASAVQYAGIVAVLALGMILFGYYVKHENYKLDADIETQAGKKADAFLPGLTSYKIFFSNVFVIGFILLSFLNIVGTLAPITGA